MKWIRTKDRLPTDDEMVLTTIWGSDVVIANEGETLIEAITRQKKEIRYVSVGRYYSDEDTWAGPDGCPSIVHPVAWAKLPEPYQDDEKVGEKNDI